MARAWSSGFELQSAVADVEWLTVVGTPAISTTTKRSGAAALRCNPSAAAHTVEQLISQNAGITSWWLRAYINVATRPSAEVAIMSMRDSTGTGVSGYITLDSAGTLRLRDRAGTQIGSASAALTNGTWYRVELNTPDAVGTNTLTARLDGAVFATGAGTTDSTLKTCSFGVGIASVPTAGQQTGTADVYFDDIAANDSTGAAQNTWPGDGSIVHLHPDSAGDNAGWTGVPAPNWDAVNEVTPDDVTTYNQVTVTGAHIDDHNCESSASRGIGASDSITLVSVGLRGGANGTTGTRQATPRIKSQAAGTVVTGTTESFAISGWTSFSNTGTNKVYRLTSYTDPQAGGAWTPAKLDTMQIGYNDGTSSASARRITTVWALVEYVPAVVAPSKAPVIISSFMGRS